jgi:hypothetical protein
MLKCGIEGGGKKMYFTINIPYRKMIFQVRLEENLKSNKPFDLEQAVRREAIIRQIENEISDSRNQYFLLRP